MDKITKILLIIALTSLVAAIFWQIGGKNLGLGKLPGDIHLKSKNGSFYFPLTTCIIMSALASVISWFFRK